ncbi:MAG: hypothetical protein ACLFXM_15660, partial [Acidimicrobiia bacterium]
TKTRVALAAIAACALTIGTAVPAGAQEEPEALGFAVDKTEAQPGTLVLGKANAADVAEHCVTDLEAFQARFQELFDIFNEFTEDGFASRFFDVTDPRIEDHEQQAFFFIGLVALGIGANIGGAAEDALPETFVMTFADIATQEPVGERGNFDPSTGDGSVVVPEIEPGNWAVAAACVGPTLDHDPLEAGIRAAGPFLEELGVPLPADPTDPFGDPALQEFMQEFLDSEATGLDLLTEFLGVIGPDLLVPIMVPDAFGAVLFCILDDQGSCPGETPPPPELDEEDTRDMAPPADAVVAAPSFTG